MRRLLIASAVILFLGTAVGQESSPVLKFGVTGSDPTGDYTRVMSEVPVQKALLAIADQPRSREFIDPALKGTNVSTDELVTLHLIKQEKRGYRIALNLFTLDSLSERCEIYILRRSPGPASDGASGFDLATFSCNREGGACAGARKAEPSFCG